MRYSLFNKPKSYKLRVPIKTWRNTLMPLIAVTLLVATIAFPAVNTNHVSAYTFPSTNDQNRTLNRPHVNLVSSGFGEVSLRFINNTNSQAFFEVRKDGVQTGTTPHPVVTGSTIHSGGISVDNRSSANPKVSTVDRTITATSKVEIRLALGGERNWDFDWTSFTVPADTTAPVITIAQPLANTVIGKSFVFRATVTDNIAVDRVDVQLRNGPSSFNPRSMARVGITNTWELSVDTTTLPDGSNLARFRAYDAANNFAAATSSNVIVDNTGGVVNAIKPIENEVINGVYTFRAEATDPNGIGSVDVQLRNGPSSFNPRQMTRVGTTNIWELQVDTRLLADGSNLARFRSYDTVGNFSADAVNNVTVDNTSPNGVAHLTPADDTHSTTANTQQITWSAATDPNGPVTYNYESSTSNQTNADGSFANPLYGPVSVGTNTYINTPNTPEGVYYYHVQAVDALGNKSAWTTPWKITVDNTKPTVAFTAPTSFAQPFSTGPTVQTSASDNGQIKAYVIHVYKGGTNTITKSCSATATELTSGNLSCDLSALPEGTYYIKAGATDKANNNRTILSGDFTIDTTAPSVPSLTTPANNSFVNTPDFGFDWTDATDTNGAVSYVWEGSYSDTTNADGGFQSVLASHNLTVSGVASPGTPDGVYYWHVRAIDAAGNKSAWTSTYKVTVDTIAPAAPVATPPADTYIFAKSITLASSDAEKIYYTTDGSTPSTTNGTLYTGAFDLLTSKTVKAIAYDAAGNASAVLTAPYVIIIPIVIPPITLPGITLGAITQTPQTTTPARTNNTPTATTPAAVTATTLGATTSPTQSEVKAAATSTETPQEPAAKPNSSVTKYWPVLPTSILAGLFWLLARRRGGE